MVGDGSALYSVQALWSAVRHAAPVTYVLLGNGGYAAVRALSSRIGVAPVPGTDITGLDFAALARSFGCPATRTEHPGELPAALAEAWAEVTTRAPSCCPCASSAAAPCTSPGPGERCSASTP